MVVLQRDSTPRTETESAIRSGDFQLIRKPSDACASPEHRRVPEPAQPVFRIGFSFGSATPLNLSRIGTAHIPRRPRPTIIALGPLRTSSSFPTRLQFFKNDRLIPFVVGADAGVPQPQPGTRAFRPRVAPRGARHPRAFDADRRGGQGLQPRRRDLLSAVLADPVPARANQVDSPFDLVQFARLERRQLRMDFALDDILRRVDRVPAVGVVDVSLPRSPSIWRKSSSRRACNSLNNRFVDSFRFMIPPDRRLSVSFNMWCGLLQRIRKPSHTCAATEHLPIAEQAQPDFRRGTWCDD